VVLEKGETVLQGMIDRLIDIDVSYGMEIYFCCVETSTFRKVDHICMWCWRRMEISWTDLVRNEEVL